MTAHQRNVSVSIDPVKLDRLAEVAVKVGLQLQPGQDLLPTAPSVALPLVRRIAEHAYKAGAGIVTPFLSDEEITLARYRYGHNESFDRAAGWLYEGMAKAFSANTARLAIVGDNPMLLSGEDPTRSRAPARPIRWPISRRWKRSSISKPTGTSSPIRARPGRSRSSPTFRRTSRWQSWRMRSLRRPASIRTARWRPGRSTTPVLRERTEWLNGQRFHALKYSGPGTDLTIDLADGHEWEGGASTARNGITCNANIPTEEVFTTPHCRRVSGHVVSSKPLSYQGTLIDNIAVRFEEGRIVEAKASRGEEVLKKVLDTDEGAARLGEVALVPHSSPISKSGLLFFNTLFDENAASPYRARPMLFEMLRRRRQADPGADCSARRQQEPHSHRLDDRIGARRISTAFTPTGAACRCSAAASGRETIAHAGRGHSSFSL